MASRTREKVLHAKGNLRFWTEDLESCEKGKCRATKQRRTNVLPDFSSFTSFAIFSLNYGMLLHYTISIFQPLLCTYIFSLSLSIFFPRSSRRVIISNNSRNYFIRRLKSSQHLSRFLFRFISVLVSRAVLSDTLFRVLRVLTPSFFLFSFFSCASVYETPTR